MPEPGTSLDGTTNHPIYDLLYVALAERRGTQLITADSRLRQRLVGIDWLVGPEQVVRR